MNAKKRLVTSLIVASIVIVMLVLLTSIGMGITPAAAQSGSCSYIVQSGDTLRTVANSLNVEVEELANGNSISSPEQFKVGMELSIPGCVELWDVAAEPLTMTNAEV